MSFYLGGNNKLLHITKGMQSATTLDGPAIASTVFHSDLNYLTVDTVYTSTIYSGVIPGYGATAYSTYSRFTVDSTTKALMGTYVWFVIAANGEVVKHALNTNAWGANPTSSTYPLTSGWVDNGTTYQAILFEFNNGVAGKFLTKGLGSAYNGTCYVCVTNILASGSVVAIPKTASSIIVDNGNLIVKGVNFLDHKYVSTAVINGTDIIGRLDSGSFQVLNSVASAESIELYSNSVSSGIRQNGKVHIDSAISNNMEISYVWPFTALFSGTTNVFSTYTIYTYPQSIPSSSIVSLSWSDAAGKNVCYFTRPIGTFTYLFGTELIAGSWGNVDKLLVGVYIYTTHIVAQVFYYKRIYTGGTSYYPNNPMYINQNLLLTVIGN